MGCTKPLKGFAIGETKNGKTQFKITSYKVDHIEYRNGHWNECIGPTIGAYAEKVVSTFQTIPCGQCVGCRLEYSRQWSIRCLLEMQNHKDNCFITLTYNDDTAPKSFVDIVNDKTGEVSKERKGEYLSLDRTDLQKFWKRCRKKGIQLRYFACGEYGDTTMRPHYHAILFGYKPNDLKLYSKNAQGDCLYTSQELTDLWGLGHVIVGEATYESCGYVARYVMKKLKGKDAAFYEAYGIEKEYVTMSRKPGIAREYYELHKDTDLYANEHSYISTSKGAKKFKPCRYFNNLLEFDNPMLYESISEKNKKLLEERKVFKDKDSSKRYWQMLEDEDFILNVKSKKGRTTI